MVRVLIVEDSYVSRELLKYIFTKDGGIEVIGMVGRGEDALAFLESMKPDKPDVITMDIEMPGLDGYTTTRRIMETRPVPIVIISVGFQYPSAEKTFKAMQAGAVAAVGKPPAPTHPEFPAKTREIVGLVKAMAKVPVVPATRIYRNLKLLRPWTQRPSRRTRITNWSSSAPQPAGPRFCRPFFPACQSHFRCQSS